MKTKKRTRVTYASREEWLAGRKNAIGASEVGTILGVNPYDTPYQLVRRKKGIDPAIPENTAMMMGHLLEDVVAQRFQIETGLQVIKNTQQDFHFVNPEKPFMKVSPDRLFWLPNMSKNDDNKGILECKTTRMSVDPDNPPMSWYFQLQYNLHVGHYKVGYLAWLVNGIDFGYRRIDYDEDLCNQMEEVLTQFYHDSIEGDIIPKDQSSADTAIRYPRQMEGKCIDSKDNINELWARLTEIKKKESELKKEKDALTGEVKMFMGDAERVVNEGKALFTWSAGKDKQSFDEKKFKEENPELWARYTTTKPASRTFLIK